MSDTLWNDTQKADCVADFHRGLAYSVIASRIGKTRNAVCGWLKRNGFSRGSVTNWKRPSKVNYQPPRKPRSRTAKPKDAPPRNPTPATDSRDVHRTRAPLIHLASNGCKWPVDRHCGRHIFCNCRRRKGSPYCAAHSAKAFALPHIVARAFAAAAAAAQRGAP